MKRISLRGSRAVSLTVLLLSSALCALVVPVASADPRFFLTVHNNSKQDLAGLWTIRGDPCCSSPMQPRTLDFTGGRSIPPGSAMVEPIEPNWYQFTAQICRRKTWRKLGWERSDKSDFWVDVNKDDEVYVVYNSSY